MLDRPDAAELLEAIAAFLEHDVVPKFEGRRRFHALVAANVAEVLAREHRLGRAQLEAELNELWRLLEREGAPPAGGGDELEQELARELCERIERGDADARPWRDLLLAYLKSSIERRLDVQNPKFRR